MHRCDDKSPICIVYRPSQFKGKRLKCRNPACAKMCCAACLSLSEKRYCTECSSPAKAFSESTRSQVPKTNSEHRQQTTVNSVGSVHHAVPTSLAEGPNAAWPDHVTSPLAWSHYAWADLSFGSSYPCYSQTVTGSNAF